MGGDRHLRVFAQHRRDHAALARSRASDRGVEGERVRPRRDRAGVGEIEHKGVFEGPGHRNHLKLPSCSEGRFLSPRDPYRDVPRESHGPATLQTGKGSFECRAQHQDASMCDMEVHEHVMVSGATRKLKGRLLHRNVDTLSRYIQKHNEYSNWEAQVWRESDKDRPELQARFFGSQAERRRWLKKKLFAMPGSPVLLFFYRYVLRLGFLDGVPGLIYCGFQAVQMFHVKAKIYELRSGKD